MEEEKKKNSTSPITIVLLVLVVLLAGYIGYDKLLNNKEENTTKTEEKKEENTNSEVPATTPVKGECPLTKFDKSYVPTEEEKQEIIDSFVAAFEDDYYKVDTKDLKIYSIHDYYLSAGVDKTSKGNGNGFFAYVSIVNGKYKTIGGGGTGDTAESVESMEYTLNMLCK